MKPKETQGKPPKNSAPVHHRNESATRQPSACAHETHRNAMKTKQINKKHKNARAFLCKGFVLGDIIFNEIQHFPLKTPVPNAKLGTFSFLKISPRALKFDTSLFRAGKSIAGATESRPRCTLSRGVLCGRTNSNTAAAT
jgi:hypothetical protein